MPTGLLAHVVTSGPGVVGLPTWALVYGMVAVLVVAALALRSTLPRLAATAVGDGGDSPAGDDDPGARPDPSVTWPAPLLWAARGIIVILLGLTIAVAWGGPVEQGANPAPLAVFSLFWVGAAWLAVALGPWWGAVSPLATVADLSPRGRRQPAAAEPTHAPVRGWWLAPLVMLAFTFAWVADPDGAQPRRIAWWLSAYVIVGLVGAWRGGRAFVDRYDPFPIALSSTAWFRRTGRRPAAAASVLGVSSLVAAGVILDRVTRTEAWGEWIGPRRTVVAEIENLLMLVWVAAVVGAAVWGLGIVTSRLARGPHEGSDHEPDDTAPLPRPGLLLASVVLPVAGALLLTRTLDPFLVQVQNLLILASDPLARGWDLLGTVDWVIEPQPLTAAGAAWVQFAVIAAGHVAALAALRDRCISAAGAAGAAKASGAAPTGGRAARAWTAMLPGTAVLLASGVACTLWLLGA